MKKGWIIGGITGIVAIAVSVSIYIQVSADGPAVEIGQVKQEEIASKIMIPGAVEMANSQTIYPPVDQSELKELRVAQGQAVKQGDVLAVYENEQLQLELQQTKLTKESNQLKINQLKRQEDQLKKKETELANTVGKKEAAKELEPDYDQVRTEQKIANLDVRQVQLQEETLNKKINDLQIKSKIDGVILTVNEKETPASELGATEPLLQIGDLNKLQATGTLSEYDMLKVQEGQTVTLRSDAVPDQKWQGKVVKIASVPKEGGAMNQMEVQAVQYPIVIEITSEAGVLKPGFQLFMDIETERKKSLVVPAEAIINEGDKSFVYTVEKNIAKKQEVKVGISANGKVEIVTGLTKADKFILNPSNDVRDGMEVAVK